MLRPLERPERARTVRPQIPIFQPGSITQLTDFSAGSRPYVQSFKR